MAIEGRYFIWTIQAGEDLADLRIVEGHLFKAINVQGRIAHDGEEALGILLYGGRQDEHVTLGYIGILKFVAAESIPLGGRLTVRAGGFYVALPGEFVVGRCLDGPATSPCLRTGMFNFAASVQLAR
jgi:hypothetical protein